jgi:hypothetical protein
MPPRKRPPIDDDWAKKAFCKYKNPLLWDLDNKDLNRYGKPKWQTGRRYCIRDCVVREACLRKALQEGDTFSVVRGGVLFNEDQLRKRKSTCLLCDYPVAPLTFDEDKNQVKAICWVCRRYTPCLTKCGRMVRRRPKVVSYYCKYCSAE